ncbi:MAG: UDP-glucose/GDP-mannose dehydrogenase family protein [Dehalococcoidales bacterium]|nr:UDP-glucose/GDP-mannose dehydrogenase family protein [Dehalococcoidales bacterium]
MTKAISVFGIGKLGFPIIACLGTKGYRIIGYDVNPDTINAVNQRKPNINETGLDNLILQADDVTATDDYKYAVKNTDVTLIIVPTPSEEDGSFTTRFAEAAVGKVAEGIREKDDYHLVVLTSTVLPGATEEKLQVVLENVSGKKCGQDFGLCYSPEFIALGTVIKDFLNPDVILIGENDEKAGRILEQIYNNVCENNPPVVRMSIRNAELAKISLNAFVTMKISFANTISELCELMPGGDSEPISRMLGFDTRIGKRNLSGALAYGGPCFPRDNRAFSHFASSLGKDALLAKATDAENYHQNARIVSMVKEKTGSTEKKKVGILGLTYKPNTNVTEESAAIKITEALVQEGISVTVYDPKGMENAKKVLGESKVSYAGSAEECITDAELCILATPWEEFKELSPDDFLSLMKQPVLIDCWRLYNGDTYSEKINYSAVGRNNGIESE